MLIRWIHRFATTSLLASSALLGGCGGGDDHAAAPATVVQIAQRDARFSTLVEAVNAADPAVAAALTGAGPLTVLAPTNDAFAALLSELGLTKAQLLANTALLTRVLQYHVVPSLVLKAEVPLATPITTAQGGTLSVSAGLAITDQRGRQSNITATDTLAINGVIHVIDKVLLPAP